MSTFLKLLYEFLINVGIVFIVMVVPMTVYLSYYPDNNIWYTLFLILSLATLSEKLMEIIWYYKIKEE